MTSSRSSSVDVPGRTPRHRLLDELALEVTDAGRLGMVVPRQVREDSRSTGGPLAACHYDVNNQ